MSTCCQPVPEPESADCAAHRFTLDGQSVAFRVARTTPTKVGQFVFPRDALCERGIVSRNGVGGKRGFRVYPPGAVTTGRQARGAERDSEFGSALRFVNSDGLPLLAVRTLTALTRLMR
ncbi:MepB family protein [Streptomyces parvus]|uniref:MepB family protein n=1 Tax=Streptomyces parvus TaxID=66428 RepID=UPI001EF23441|nr:MepB family protein [Streptomyces parvus]